ncbi:MAG: PEGA domain-containing protein [Nannocystales bacterium]
MLRIGTCGGTPGLGSAALVAAFFVAVSPLTALGAKPKAKTRVAVMPLLTEGDVPSEVRSEAREEVKAALENKNVELVDGRPTGANCTDFECIHSVAEDADAQWVVQPALSTIDHDYGIAVRLFDAAGNLKADEASTCEICSYPDAVEALVTGAKQLKVPLLELVENPYGDREQETHEAEAISRFAIRTEPEGALVKIDGERVGKTPLELEVEPGLRDIEITLRNHNDVVETVRAPRGGSEMLNYTLTKNNEKQTRALRITGWTFSMLGVGLLGAGVPLLALEEEPVKRQCSGNDVDFEGRCRYRYDTLLPGALLTGFGIASLLTGITTGVIAASRRDKGPSNGTLDSMDEDTISVRPIIGPTSAGVRVRF